MKKTFEGLVEREIWDVEDDDDYQVVEFHEQVFESDGFKEGDQVKITIEKV